MNGDDLVTGCPPIQACLRRPVSKVIETMVLLRDFWCKPRFEYCQAVGGKVS